MWCLRRFGRPKWFLILSGLTFVALGTFYFSFWEVPEWIPFLSETKEDSSDSSSSLEWINHGDGEGIHRPKYPICDQTKNDMSYRPKTRYCEWNTSLKDCYDMLSSDLNNRESWILLGDSGLANLAYFMSEAWPFNALDVATRRHSCQNLAYYGLPPPDDGWISPDPLKGEGPIGFGKQNPYCMDCTKCWNIMMKDSLMPERYMEYLVMEYARDVSIPTLVSTTTQETVIYYLGTKSPSVCVASAGLQDAAITPPISTDVYVANAGKYLALLQRACDFVVWISIPAVVENESISQDNCRLKEWNSAMLQFIDEHNFENVFVIDIWEKSLNTDHQGSSGAASLALEKHFYDEFSKLFLDLMVSPNVAKSP